MKKPVGSIDEPEPKAPRADRPPSEGFVVVVDGHFKSEFEPAEADESSGRKLKSTYLMLKIEIYDALQRSEPYWAKKLRSGSTVSAARSFDGGRSESRRRVDVHKQKRCA